MDRLAFNFCAPLSIIADDVVIEGARWGGRQARLLLAALVLQRHRAMPHDELAELLWPAELPPSWEPALRGVLSKVRATLVSAGLPPSDALTVAFGCYQVHLPPGTVVDVEAATEAARVAERALDGGDAEKACEQALVAVDVLSRPFLSGENGAWAEDVRRDLHARLVGALETLSEARARRGHASLAAEAAEEAIALAPLRESAYRHLMAAHEVAGNRGEALKAYERCRRVLAEELGVDPSSKTEAAYMDLLGDDTPGNLPPATTDPLGPFTLPPGLRTVTPLVARDEDLEQIHDAWRAAKHGRQVVFVVGRRGTGKSALVAEAAAAAHADGAIALHGRCDRHLLIPYQGVVDALGHYVTQCPPERLRREVSGVDAALALLIPELTERLPETAWGDGGQPEVERQRLFASVAVFLSRVAATTPVVLVVDDLHWADPSLLLLLRHLARALERAPVLIVATYSDDEMNENPAAMEAVGDLSREVGVRSVELEALDEGAIVALITRMGIETNEPPEAVARRLCRETDGNPFFVIEVLRHVKETGRLLSEPGTGAPDDLTADAGIPGSVTAAIRRRVARLRPQTIDALELAAVAGREFQFDVLNRAGQLEEEALADAMEEAVASGLLLEIPTAIGSYRFAQSLVREVVYHSQTVTRRARLHARLARALRDLDEESDRQIAELAHHYWMAGPLADRAAAIDATVRAGERALVQLAYEKAATHFERSLRLGLEAPGQEVRRCQVLMSLATAQRKAGRVAEARDAYLLAADLARRLGSPEALASCALGLGAGSEAISAWIADEVRISLLEEALEALGENNDELRVSVSAALAKALSFSEERQRGDDLARQAVETARRIASPSALLPAISASRVVARGPGNSELRRAYTEEMVALAEAARDPELTVRARLRRLEDLFEFGERAEADREVELVLELAGKLYQPYYMWRAVTWDALRAMVDGRFADAGRRIQEGLDLWPADPHRDAVLCSHIQLAALAAMQGRPGDGEHGVRLVADGYDMIPSYRCFLAAILARRGRRSEAEMEFERFAADGFVSPPFDSNWLFGMAALAETCAVLRDTSQAEVLYQLLLPFADRMVVLEAFGGAGSFGGPVSYYLGVLAAQMDRGPEAAAHLRAALEAATSMRAAPWMARVAEALGAPEASAPPISPPSTPDDDG